MLRDGYVRFGRWFTRLLDDQTSGSMVGGDGATTTAALPAYVMATRLEFDVKSENHVCATVKTQCQPPLLALSPRHLRISDRQAVILAPWSLRATLLPHQPLRELQNAGADRLNTSSTSIGSSASTSAHNTSGGAFNIDDPTATATGALPDEVRVEVQLAWDEWRRILTLPLDIGDLNDDATTSNDRDGGDGNEDETVNTAAANDDSDEQENRATTQSSARKRRPAIGGDDDTAANKTTIAAAATDSKAAPLPKFALVEVEGVRMFWPTCLIAIVAPDPRDATQKDAADRERAAAVGADAELRDSLVGLAAHSHLELLDTKRAKTHATRRRDSYGECQHGHWVF